MSARYYQGKTVVGQVRASDAKNFRDVVEILRLCPTLPIAHADFLALDEKQRNEKKQVPYFVPACFKNSPSDRVYDQGTHCNLIFLDIDPEKEKRNGKWVETGRYPAAPFVKDPDSIFAALDGINFAAHLTASSTPERPRMRIIVDAEKIPLSAYPAAATAIAARLGLSSITKESKVAVQPMFLPVLFRDTPDEEHPVIAFHFDGRAFTVNDIGDEAFIEEGTAPVRSTETASVDALEYLRAPVPEVTLKIAAEMLNAIDPDCSRPDWLNCAFALKHQFSPHKEAEAFELFDEWSKRGTKYGGEDETRATWKSSKPTSNGRLPVTIRSLLHLAISHGWDDKKLKEDFFASTVRWVEEVDNFSDLLAKGVKKILATPLITNVQEDILISQICTQAKKRFSYTISVTAVRKDLLRLKTEAKNAEAEKEKIKEPIWTKGVCYVSAAQEFYRHKTGEKYKTEAFNAAYGRHLLADPEKLKAAGVEVTPQNLATPLVLPSHYALNHIKILTAYDYAYDPSQPADVIFVNHGKKYVNTYTPTYPELDAKRAKWAGELFMSHLNKLIAEDQYRRTLVDFMAFQVQFPGRKIRWAVLLQGTEGAGKTFLAEAMKAVLGAEHVRAIDGSTITTGWNEWAFGKQLVVLEEIRVAGTSRYEIMNKMKQLITNVDIPINERFRNTRQVENITNYMIFSNHHDALALTPGDRRYFVLKSPLQTKAQVLALGDNYFPPLFAMLRDYPGALRSFFADWEISPGFKADGHAPRTKYVTEMVNDSANELTATVRRLLLEADHPLIQYDIVSAKTLRHILQNEEGLTRVTDQQIAQTLRDEGMHSVGRHMVDADRHYIWSRNGHSPEEAAAIATDRVKRDLKNLGMELIYG